MDNNRYLGDGVYISWDGYQIKLYTSDGVKVIDVIYLDPHIQVALTKYIEDISEGRIQPA